MRRALLAATTACATACTTVLVGAVTAAPAAAAEVCVADPTGDAGALTDGSTTERTARADLLEVCLDSTATELVLTVMVADPVDPTTDPSWTTGRAPARLDLNLDLDGDGSYDTTFVYSASGGTITVEQVVQQGQQGCTGEGSSTGEQYVAELPASCLGRPARLSAAAYLVYPDAPEDPDAPVWYDFTELTEPLDTGYGITVSRLGGADRWQTAAQIAQATYPQGGDSLVVARGDDFTDALTSVNVGGPVLLTPFADLPEPSAAIVRDWRPVDVEVLGSTSVVSTRVEQQLRDLGAAVDRTAGRDRYETAERSYYASYTFESRIPSEVDGLRTALLVSGTDFPDAVSAAPLAAGEALPLLLTARDALPAPTVRALQYQGGSSAGIEQVVVVGGPAAVSDQVLEQVRALGLQVRRVSGTDRQQTAVEVFRFAEEHFGWTLDHVHLARGDDFADAVAVGAHAGLERAPVLLTASSTDLGATTRDLLTARRGSVTSMDVLGGTHAISDDVVWDAYDAAR